MEAKDLSRIQDIKNKHCIHHIGLANKMSKLITNPEKAQGRYEASCSIFGSSHDVSQIFLQRAKELSGSAPVIRKVEVGIISTIGKTAVAMVDHFEDVVITPAIKAIKRTKEDFPLSKRVKHGDKKGTVVSHEGETEDFIFVLFDDESKAQDINIYNLKFA
jgi:hypothetical protein